MKLMALFIIQREKLSFLLINSNILLQLLFRYMIETMQERKKNGKEGKMGYAEKMGIIMKGVSIAKKLEENNDGRNFAIIFA